ncbi:MAG: alkaline phosphatase D family protein [Actinomycetota bacterium]
MGERLDRRTFIRAAGGSLLAGAWLSSCDPASETSGRLARLLPDGFSGTGPGWGPGWHNVRYESSIGRAEGAAFAEVEASTGKIMRVDIPQREYMAVPVVHAGAEVADGTVSSEVLLHSAVEAGVLARWSYDVAYALVVTEGRALLYKYSTEDRTTLAATDVAETEGWLKLRLRVSGNRIDGVVESDITYRISARDTDPLPAGLVGAVVNPISASRGGRAEFRSFGVRAPKDVRRSSPGFAYTFTGAVVPEGDGFKARVAARTLIPEDAWFEIARDESFVDARAVGPFQPEGGLGAVRAWIDGLDPGREYFWRPVARRGRSGAVAGPPARFKTPMPGAAVRFVFASCTTARARAYPSFSTAASFRPDFYLHAGDWGYANQSSFAHRADHFQGRWTRLLRIARPLLRSTPLLFWQDDHDYQADNGWAETVQEFTIEAFDELHANPTDTYFDLRWGDVHIWCLDCRLFASDPGAPDDAGKTRLGLEQKEWLKRGMRASDAPVRIVASPMVFRNKTREDPGWHSVYTRERDELLSFFSSLDARVLVLSGDAHGQRLIHHFEFGDLFEINSSGTDFPEGGQQGNHDPEHTLANVSGRNGFAVIDVDPAGPNRKITARSVDARDGSTLFSKVLSVGPARS